MEDIIYELFDETYESSEYTPEINSISLPEVDLRVGEVVKTGKLADQYNSTASDKLITADMIIESYLDYPEEEDFYLNIGSKKVFIEQYGNLSVNSNDAESVKFLIKNIHP